MRTKIYVFFEVCSNERRVQVRQAFTLAKVIEELCQSNFQYNFTPSNKYILFS